MNPRCLVALLLVVLLYSTCEAKLNMVNSNARALTLEGTTSAMPYIRFEDTAECDNVVNNWEDELGGNGEPIGACVYRDYCLSNASIVVVTQNQPCQIARENADPNFNIVFADFNDIRFEVSLYASSGPTDAAHARVTPISVAGWPFTLCDVGHHCVHTTPASIYRLRFQV